MRMDQRTYLLHWVADEDSPDDPDAGGWDAVDGGTTATVVCIIRGELAVIGLVGDSSVRCCLADSRSARMFPTHRVLMEEHSPPNLSEYVRIQQLSPPPMKSKVRFVYDCPDFEEFDIFDRGQMGSAPLGDGPAERRRPRAACERTRVTTASRSRHPGDASRTARSPWRQRKEGAGADRNGRGAAITMTRSLGDFYAHHHGVTYVPEVATLPLRMIDASKHAEPHLYLASDGIWDLWDFDEVAETWCRPTRPEAVEEEEEEEAQRGKNGNNLQMALAEVEKLANGLIDSTQQRGNNFYGESADNLTWLLTTIEPADGSRSALQCRRRRGTACASSYYDCACFYCGAFLSGLCEMEVPPSTSRCDRLCGEGGGDAQEGRGRDHGCDGGEGEGGGGGGGTGGGNQEGADEVEARAARRAEEAAA